MGEEIKARFVIQSCYTRCTLKVTMQAYLWDKN